MRRWLTGRGIGSDVHYPRGVHQEPRFSAGAPRLPNTERLVERLLSLPIQPEVATGNVAEIVGAIRDGLGSSTSQ
jgi:dTDP-4-amino-4,6-dideoxygalactose transaminase